MMNGQSRPPLPSPPSPGNMKHKIISTKSRSCVLLPGSGSRSQEKWSSRMLPPPSPAKYVKKRFPVSEKSNHSFADKVSGDNLCRGHLFSAVPLFLKIKMIQSLEKFQKHY